jgi:raffinose/stachyose/melibiose transport system permease protein
MTAASRRRGARAAVRALPIHLLLAVVAAIMAYPLLVMVMTAFKSNAEVFQNPVGPPLAPTVENFATSWVVGDFGTLFVNSVVFTTASMALAIVVSSLAAYAVVRRTSRGSSLVYLLIAAGIFLPLQLAIIPQFRIIRDLGLVDSYLGVVLVYAAGSVPFGVFLMAAFMHAIPREFAEAADVDGAGYLGTWWRIYLPMSRPAIGSFLVLQGVGVWNDYLVPLLLLSDPGKRTLTTGVLIFRQQYVAQWGNIMAGVVIMTVPVIVVFLVAQRSFANGLFAGGVK